MHAATSEETVGGCRNWSRRVFPENLDRIWNGSGTDLDRMWTGVVDEITTKIFRFVAEFPNKFCAFVGPFSQQRGHQDPHFALQVVM